MGLRVFSAFAADLLRTKSSSLELAVEKEHVSSPPGNGSCKLCITFLYHCLGPFYQDYSGFVGDDRNVEKRAYLVEWEAEDRFRVPTQLSK